MGLVILDTTLVVVSRSRGGRPVMSGGRDHITHRLARRVGAPRNVALALATAQLTICAVTIGVVEAGIGWVLLAGGAGLVLGGVLVWQFETSRWSADAMPEAPLPAQAIARQVGAGAAPAPATFAVEQKVTR